MYFDAKAITQLISDEDAAQKAAPAIAALRKRFTSPLAIVEAVLVLGSGKNGAETAAQVQALLDAADIETRDIPPASKLIEAAAKAEGGDALSVLNAAAAEYYEVETFSLEDALAAPAADEVIAEVVTEAAVIETPATPAKSDAKGA
ncbi:PIN domain-containing protein [Paracoccus lutimaris]|uniref:PIN domain-containing protein n=1 Tax=Paracoccus lutimaris TaxID=1490030 RepID=A0A368YXC5_9RHOB|nr:PIN domain-containing protein [Paracoccus lutimaris]RCW84823.1 PIN domain-containing protein [Paracoccus lutimaris]